MSDTGREFALVGDHAENLASGAIIAPGERVHPDQIGDGDGWLIEEGRLVEIEPPDEPTITALRAKARELDIEGRSSMSAENLRAAIDEAEAPIIAAARDGVAQGDVGKGGGS